MKKFKEKLGTIPCPGWLFAIGVVVYCETLLHIWITEEFMANRVSGILLFAVGFGGVLGQIAAFIGHKNWGKWVTVALTGLVSAFYIVEFFVADAYQTFMPLGTLLGGAKGVATDFGDVVVDLVLRDFWRIILVMLPVVLYALFACPTKTSWRSRWIGLALAVVAYLAGFALVLNGQDAERMSSTYNFDSSIRVLGLNMTMTLDTVRGSEEEAGGDFVITAPPAPVETAPPVQAQPEDPAEETVAETEPIVYADNIMEALDFAALMEEETNSRIDKIHQYVSSSIPTKQNEYTGLFAGKNLIVITAEAFAAEVIDPELTPTLYRLANEGIKFNDFYQPMWGGSTSSGEYSILTGLVSASGTNSVREAIQQDLFLCIGKQLQKQGYFSAAYHNHLHTFYDRHETHTNFGYDTFMGLHNGMEEGVKEIWPESDLEMIDFTVPQYIDQQPFSIYYMTVSGHCRYNWGGNKMAKKNKEAVLHLDYSETVQAYLASQLELENALTSLVRQLEEAGIADDTVIVLAADHYPYGLEKGSTWSNKEDYIGELYGYKYESIVQRDHNALIIWSGCIEDMDLVIDDPVYSLDILPTISNLFGVDYDSRLLVGRDVFSEAEPIVLWYDHTWVTDKGWYDSSKGKFYPNEGVEVEEGYVDRIKAIVSNKIYYSREVAATDYFDYLSEALGYQ